MKKLQVILAFILSLALFTSCDVDPPINQEAPDLPPQEMFSMPTTALSTMEPDTAVPNANATYRNWTFSAINLVVWNTAIAVHAGIPIASFGKAVNQRAVYIGNDTFSWTYVYEAPAILGGKSYDVVLTAQYINNFQEVEWIMNVTEQGSTNTFEWYKGISSTDFSEAHFTVNRNPANPEGYLDIEFEKDLSSGDFKIRYTSVAASDPGLGGYIEYRENVGAAFDRAFDIFGGANKPGESIEIQWNQQNENGRVKNLEFFNDSNWHCWDENQADTSC
ncbi:MAG: hypothetical protein MRZ79_15075 [Bacteroidia bacterium]|nr:hypothetical protein [Bacteroidia bacterium]